MEGQSFYNDYTFTRIPRSFHFIGIGKSGCQIIESILRTGFIEDSLADTSSRVTTLAIDIGEQDILFTRDVYNSFIGRLKDRGIPSERVQLRTVALPVPKNDELFSALKRFPEFLKKEYPMFQKNPNYTPWISADQPLPKPGERIPRAIAKAIYGKAYYQDKILDKELTDFANSVRAAKLPPLVFIAFGIAGGTGSGIALDLARHLSHVKMPEIAICGLGFLPCDGDPEEIRGANLYSALNEIDLMMDANKNAQVTAVWGDIYRNPFSGGFMMVPLQPAFERLGRYSVDAENKFKAKKSRLRGWQVNKIKVTTKFIDDCISKLLTEDYGREFIKRTARVGLFGPWHEGGVKNEKCYAFISVNKFIHPAAAVVLGAPQADFRKEISLMIPESIDAIPLSKGFHTSFMELHINAPRGMWTNKLTDQLVEAILPYVYGKRDELLVFNHESFDLLNCFAYLILPGVSRTDITYFKEAKEKYDNIREYKQKLLIHSLMLENGVIVSEPSDVFKGRAGKSLWGDSSNVCIPYDMITGMVEEAPDLGAIQQASTAGLVPLIVCKRKGQ